MSRRLSNGIADRIAGRHALLLIVLLAALLRFASLDAQSFWFDEFLTVGDIDRGFGDMLRDLDELGEITPPLYFILASAWSTLFGDGEVGLRSLSAVLGTATIPVLYAIARTVSTERAGLYAAAFGAVNPLLIWYSQEARSYALLIFLSALSLLFTVLALRDDRPVWLLCWTAVAGLALTTHYLAGALLLPEAALLVLRLRGRRLEPIAAVAGLVAVVVGSAPLIAEQVGTASWFGDIPLASRLAEVPPHFLVGLSTPTALLPLLAGVLACAGIVSALVLGRRQERQAVVLTAGIGLGGFIVLLVGSLADHDYLLTRNALPLWIPLAVAVGVAFGASGAAPRLRFAGAVCLFSISLGVAIWAALTPPSHRPDWRGVAADLGEPSVNRIVLAPGWEASPLELYLPGSEFAAPGESLDRELVVIRLKSGIDHAIGGNGGGECDGFTWWGGLCTSELTQSQRPVPDGFVLMDTGSTEQMDFEVYRAKTESASVSTEGLPAGSAIHQPRP
jgi:4-amino-4-deoxy-L-arabinose transferase-like glycosyltransferase